MDVDRYNENKPLLVEFIRDTWHFKKFVNMPFRFIALFCGNQSMKTSSVCFQYVMRVLGWHPIPKKNIVYAECSTRNKDNIAPHGHFMTTDGIESYEKGTFCINKLPEDKKCPYCKAPLVIHRRKSKKIRLASETLPGDKESISADGTETAETKNTIYPELKRWMPPYLIKRDITFRNPAMVVTDPYSGMKLNDSVNKASDIVFDFVSYSQTIQAGAGVQRISIYCDEEPPKDFWDEQIPRLLAEDGDIILGLTPAQQITWTFDELYERARVYYRTEAVCEFLNKTEKNKKYEQIEVTESSKPIGVMLAATDDNPTMGKDAIKELFEGVDDPDVLATRRYGIHRQVSGRIFKSFNYKVHFIDFEQYFPDGIFKSWNHYRMIDYHPHNKWACVWMSVSPHDEAFVWKEWSPDPEKIITRAIVNELALMSSDYKFVFNIIDPEAEINQPNTGTSTTQDINQYFMELKQEGICTGGYWQPWFTKGARGREIIRTRLKNSVDCKRPFNNKVQEQGISRYVPTLWISTRCPETARSLKQWSLEGSLRSRRNVEKDRSEKPAQKWSHYCTALECAFKDKRLRPPLVVVPTRRNTVERFQGNRRAYS